VEHLAYIQPLCRHAKIYIGIRNDLESVLQKHH